MTMYDEARSPHHGSNIFEVGLSISQHNRHRLNSFLEVYFIRHHYTAAAALISFTIVCIPKSSPSIFFLSYFLFILYFFYLFFFFLLYSFFFLTFINLKSIKKANVLK